MAKGYSEPPKRKYIDENLVRVQREAKERMAYLLEHGTEEEFVAALKAWLGENLKPERMQRCVKQFHALRAEKRGL